jgi:glycosyltransferase involved in cell wall biosynthesis
MNQRYIEAAKACEDLISVDTNSASWLQTVDFSLSQNIKLVPNYEDISAFKPKEDYLENRDKTVILYPRQLYAARGLYLVLEIMDDILEKYPAVEFHFVGRGTGQDLAAGLRHTAAPLGEVRPALARPRPAVCKAEARRIAADRVSQGHGGAISALLAAEPSAGNEIGTARARRRTWQ